MFGKRFSVDYSNRRGFELNYIIGVWNAGLGFYIDGVWILVDFFFIKRK